VVFELEATEPEALPAGAPAEEVQADRAECGIAWPSPGESPPFWERPARTAPAALRAPWAVLRPA